MNNKIYIYLFLLFTFFVFFVSCSNNNDTSSNKKINYVQSIAASSSLNKTISSKSSENGVFSSSKANNPVKNNSSKNTTTSIISNSSLHTSTRILTSNSSLHTSSRILSSKLSSSKNSSSKSSSRIVQSSSNASSSSKISQISSITNISINDGINLYKNALNNTLGQQYISYNFTNTMTGVDTVNRTGNMVIQNNSSKDVFIKSYTDGNIIYCDGSKLFFKNIGNTGAVIYIGKSYIKEDYNKYINLILSDIDRTTIKSYNGYISADTTTLNFDCINYNDYKKISDIFGFKSTNFTISKITLDVQINNGLIKKYTQTFEVVLDGIQSKCVIDISFYTVAKDYVLTAPPYIKLIN